MVCVVRTNHCWAKPSLTVRVALRDKQLGRMTAEARCDIPESNDKAELPATVTIRDGSGDEVARGRVTVVIGPVE